MTKHCLKLATVALALVAFDATRAQAQIAIAPMAGVYVQGNSFASLRQNTNELRVKRESKLGLGLNVEVGAIRGSLAYVSGATLSDEGATNTADIGEGSVLAGAVDVMIKPIPRIVIFQPYLFVGGGFKNQEYTYTDDRFNAFPSDQRDFTLHGGIGADVMFGGIGIVAEISDFISKSGTSFNQHDAFGMVGLKVRL